MKFYSMKNKFQDTFNTPFPASNDAEAIYQIRLVINQKREPDIIAEDFALHRIGEFDPDLGKFNNDHEVLISDCSSLRVKKEGVVNE